MFRRMISHMCKFPYTYKITETKHSLERETNISYGVSVSLNGIRICVIEDITTNQSKPNELVELFNQLKLEPIHLRDVIDDFILSV